MSALIAALVATALDIATTVMALSLNGREANPFLAFLLGEEPKKRLVRSALVLVVANAVLMLSLYLLAGTDDVAWTVVTLCHSIAIIINSLSIRELRLARRSL